MRTRSFLGLIVLAALWILPAGCASTRPGPNGAGQPVGAKSSKFVHAVFFTFKPEVTDEQTAEFIRDCYALKKIQAVRKLDAGRRDERMTRDVNVTDYTVGLVVYFNDMAGHDEYIAHPVHQELVDKHKDKWASVRVFDFDAK